MEYFELKITPMIMIFITQVKKESHIPGDNTKSSVAPILMRYQRGCQHVSFDFFFVQIQN